MIFDRFRPKPLFEMSLAWTVQDLNGKILRKTKSKRCHSYVRAMIDLLTVQLAQATQVCADTGNTARAVTIEDNTFGTVAAAGVTAFGLVVGTGANAVAIGDYALQTIIANGTGAGQLQYSASSYTAAITVGSTRQMGLSRTFTNNSGGTVTVTEVGIYSYGGGTVWYFCLERTLSTQAILNTASATATYTLSVTV